MNQIHIISATQTALKEVLINSEKKGRFLLDCQFVIKTIIIVNLIEKIPPKYNLVKLASCLVLKHIVENHETSANRSKKLHPRLLIMQSFSLMKCKKLFVESILMNSSNRITLMIDWMFSWENIFLERKICGMCVS